MKRKSAESVDRNWSLVLVASIYMIIGLTLVVIAVINISLFGWWSLIIGLAGATPVAAAVVSIIKNDPSWMLLDLIIPG